VRRRWIRLGDDKIAMIGSATVSPLATMNLTPTLQREIDQLALSQGISSEQFILQAIAEKITILKQPASGAEASLKEKDGLLVFDTEPLDQIDFNRLESTKIRQPRIPGSAIGTLTIVAEDKAHLEDFGDYMP
jgi:hypothetical protein